MKPVKDVKFIIYQALYIFVICVVAIKGANLDLKEVEERRMRGETIVEVDTLDNIILNKTEFDAYVKFDREKQRIVSIEEFEKNPERYRPVSVDPVMPYISNNPETEQITEKEQPDITEKEIKIDLVDYTSKLNLTQFTTASVKNPFAQPMEFAGRTIAPNSTASVTLGGESSLLMKVGNSSATVGVKPNKKPQVSIQRMTTMNEDVKVTTLQRTTCFRVTISDDFPDQLEVKINGPVSYKQVNKTTYDVTMNAFSSKAAFDNYTDNRQSPYTLGFTVSVTDKLAGHKITGQNSFVFGEW